MATASTLVLAGRPVDRARLAAVCQRFGVSELSVFGSVARGDAHPDSDVDLLFTLAPGARLGFALFDLERELTELFGRNIDLLSKDSIHRLLRDAVLAEARVLYAA
jgi:predicted nucleotidyltransferase